MNALVWAQAHPVPAALTAAVALVVALLLARAGRRAVGRTPAAVVVASVGAIACTAYSGDTSWRFAAHRLGMTSHGERSALFLAAELGLFACALMARQNLRERGAPGTPGLLVWFITGVQVIPAYSESGIVGGTVRAVVGPVMAALLWHLAMGIELRHRQPGALTNSLPALLARELRERLLSRLGLALRDRTAEQITRDRATARAVRLAARRHLGPWGRAALKAAVAKADAGTSGEQRQQLLQMLAGRRSAALLRTIDLASPWESAPEVTVEQVIEEPPALPPARPPVVPAGARLLPLEVVRKPVKRFRLEHSAGPLTSLWKDAPKFPGDQHAPRWTVGQAVISQVPVPALPPAPVVIPPVKPGTFHLDHFKEQLVPDEPDVTAAVPAEQGREVVTEVITLSPAELRRRARKLNRDAVRSSGKAVTIKALQDEFGLSRRDATELRREVVTAALITGEAQS
ncbi:hypothetical protein ACFWN1_17960 [Streptomyces sp. NPDC058459]|uniref:hypothetical protein n=1 Tax=Streptomyces sp. NPDC058459 TaxID=3346508 RepID=UPI00365A7C4A